MNKNLCVLFLLLVLVAIGKSWDDNNNPDIMGDSFTHKYSSFRSEASVRQTPWSDSYWPSFKSGIANRWQRSNPQNFEYNLYSKRELQSMSEDEIKTLSPAEKLDIYQLRYDYPTVHAEWERTSPNDEEWEGICHGWAPASQHYRQPSPVTLTNSDGINIPFGSSDVKALLSYWVAVYDDAISSILFCGARCNKDIEESPEYENTTKCEDLDVASFQIILGNLIGKQGVGFIMDRDRSVQVWNQPVIGYSSSSREIYSSSGRKTYSVHNTITYASEKKPRWAPTEVNEINEDYSYTIDVDSNGRVVGGDWRSWKRPDFVWNGEINDFSGYFRSVGRIYSASINAPDDQEWGKRSISRLERSTHIQTLRTDVGGFSMEPYDTQLMKSWNIDVTNATEIQITFDWIDTERVFDKINIFEGYDGSGPLVSVLYGDKKGPIKVKVASSGAFISFVSGILTNGGKGFSATYEALGKKKSI